MTLSDFPLTELFFPKSGGRRRRSTTDASLPVPPVDAWPDIIPRRGDTNAATPLPNLSAFRIHPQLLRCTPPEWALRSALPPSTSNPADARRSFFLRDNALPAGHATRYPNSLGPEPPLLPAPELQRHSLPAFSPDHTGSVYPRSFPSFLPLPEVHQARPAASEPAKTPRPQSAGTPSPLSKPGPPFSFFFFFPPLPSVRWGG